MPTLVTPVSAREPLVTGVIGCRWAAARGALLTLALMCFAAAVALHPALAARYLSSDGELAAASQRALYVAEAALGAAAVAVLLVWHRWRISTPRRERIMLGVASVGGSLLISGLCAETGLTVIHRFIKPLGAERHYFFEYDTVLGWKHRPRSLATFKSAVVRIDADGLRVSGRERGPFRSRVLLLGDSQAFGDGVAAEDTFAARLEIDIPGLRVLNASVIGYGTDQQLLYFEQQARRFAPDFTVVALNAYDLRDNLSTRVRSGYAKPRFVMTAAGLTLTNVPVPGNGLVDRLQRGLQYRSHLYRLMGRMWRSAGRQSEATEELARPGRRLALEVYPDEAQVELGLSVTAAILDRLAHTARRTGSRLIVLFLPYQMDFADDGTYTRRTKQLVRLLEQRAATGNFVFLDGRSGLAGGRVERLFRDPMHLTPEGHQRVATLLASALAVDKKVVSRTHEH
jgi:hypothetical protein